MIVTVFLFFFICDGGSEMNEEDQNPASAKSDAPKGYLMNWVDAAFLGLINFPFSNSWSACDPPKKRPVPVPVAPQPAKK